MEKTTVLQLTETELYYVQTALSLFEDLSKLYLSHNENYYDFYRDNVHGILMDRVASAISVINEKEN